MSDGVFHAEWSAMVGFAALPTRHALLGRTGFFQFFDVTFHGALNELSLVPNAAFAGAYR